MDANKHSTEECLELYSLGRLPDSEVIEVEEHLLFCEPCRDKLEETAAFAVAMREQLAKPAEKVRFGWPALGISWPNFAMPKLAMAGAFAAVVLALGVYWAGGNRTLIPVASITLNAVRDGSEPAVSGARELDMTVTGVPSSGGPFTVDVVDASGAKVWTGTPTGAAPAAQVKVNRRLSPGEYFVRLNNAAGQIHEYRFRVNE